MKRIITCNDGTWNKPNSTYQGKPVRTNVQKIFDYILRQDKTGITQIRYYDAGVGSAGKWYTRLLCGATGKGIDENILDSYKFICWNYEPGDELFLFGFSRGAYTARSLAGLIRKCGIIKTNDLNLINQAYKLYRNHDVSAKSEEAVEFRRKNCYEPSIKFIGVWDTVGSLGIPLSWFQWYNKKKYSFHDTTLSSMIDNAFHALAVDEKRGNFAPTLWKQSEDAKSRMVEQVLEQRWFPGVHSNVGGGYPDERLSDISLRWIIEKAGALGLALDQEAIAQNVKGNAEGTLYNSKSGIFRFTPSYDRLIEDGKFIDDSVKSRMQAINTYLPNNLPK